MVGSGERKKVEREIDIEIKKLTVHSDQTDDRIPDNDIEESKFFSEITKGK